MSGRKLSVRSNPENANHHLYNNHGTWWCHFTLHHDNQKERVRQSLKTRDVNEARARRDALLASYSQSESPAQTNTQEAWAAKAELFFKPVELAILAAYVGKRGLLPDHIRSIEPYRVYDPLDWDQEQGGIVPLLDDFGKQNNLAFSNAVARICLSEILDTLPQWAASDGNGTLILGRRIVSPLELPPRVLLRKHLFTINWANSAPGYSWPEAYYATELPFFNVVVVTASVDCTDELGYSDIALGWFESSAPRVEAIRNIIEGHWLEFAAANPEHTGWECVTDPGEIDFDTAEKWAKDIWQPEPSDAEDSAEIELSDQD